MPSIVKKISKFTKREIDAFFQHARRVIKLPTCSILVAPRQKDFGRILIITSRKVGNAPERNLMRRRLKSIFYEEKLFNQAFDCVIIVYNKATALTFEQLKQLLLTTLHKVYQDNENTTFQ